MLDRDRLCRIFGVLVVSVVLLAVANTAVFVYGCTIAPEPAIILNYDELRDCGTTPMYEPHPYLSYQHTPGDDGRFMIGAHGYRGQTPDNVSASTSVLTLGGSAVFGLGVENWRQDLARQLADRLSANGTQVTGINGGAVGYTSWESMINLATKGRAVDPEIVVIYHGLNDVWPRLVPPDRYRSDNTGYRTSWTRDDQDLSLLRLTRDSPLYLAEMATTQDYRRGPSRLEQNPPRFFRSNTASMIALARQMDAVPVLATYPTTRAFDEYASSPLFQAGIRQHNNVTRRLAERYGVPLVDLAASMPEQERWWSSSRHPSVNGTRFQARQIAAVIRNDTTPEQRWED